LADVEIIELPVDRWREYRELRLRALQSDPIAFGSTYKESVAYPEGFWRGRLANRRNIMLFAERGGRLVGTAAALVGIEGEPATALIVGVFVVSEHRAQGIARRLLETILGCLGSIAEIARIRLDVTETQEAAMALYRSLGFAVVGRVEGEIRRGDRVYDELVMERRNA
jgi:ribosomal protein S18 acetylase RimI-like enzyme